MVFFLPLQEYNMVLNFTMWYRLDFLLNRNIFSISLFHFIRIFTFCFFLCHPGMSQIQKY